MAGLSRKTYRFLTKLVFAKLALMLAVMMTLMMATMSAQLLTAQLTSGADVNYEPSFSCFGVHASDVQIAGLEVFSRTLYGNTSTLETTHNDFVCESASDIKEGIRYRYRIANTVEDLILPSVSESTVLGDGVKYDSDNIGISDALITSAVGIGSSQDLLFTPVDGQALVAGFDLLFEDATSYLVHEICAVHSDADLTVPNRVRELRGSGGIKGDDFFDYGSCVRFSYNPVPYLKFGFDIGGEGVLEAAYVSRSLSTEAPMSVSVLSENDLADRPLTSADFGGVKCAHPLASEVSSYPEAYLRFADDASGTQPSLCVYESAVDDSFVPDTPAYLEQVLPQVTVEESRFLPEGGKYRIRLSGSRLVDSLNNEILIDTNSLSDMASFNFVSPVSFDDDGVALLQSADFEVDVVRADGSLWFSQIDTAITTDSVSVTARDVVPPFVSTFRTRLTEKDGKYVNYIGPHMSNAGSIEGTYSDSVISSQYDSSGMSDKGVGDEGAVYERSGRAEVTMNASSPTRGSFVVKPIVEFGSTDSEMPLHLIVQDKASNASLTNVSLYLDVTAPRISVVDYPTVALARSSDPLKIVVNAFDEGALAGKYASGIDSLSLTIRKMNDPSSTPAYSTSFRDTSSYFTPVLQQSLSYGSHPLSISDDKGVFVFDTSSMSPGRYVAEISATDAVNNVGTSSVCPLSTDAQGNMLRVANTPCRIYIDVVSFGLRDVKIDLGDSVFDLPHMNSKTFFVDPEVLSFNIDLSGVVEGALPGNGIDIRGVISDGESELDIDLDRNLIEEQEYSASFRGRSAPEAGLPVFSFKLGTTYTIELFAGFDGTQVPVYNSSLSVQQRGAAFVDENPVIVAQDDIAASYLGVAAGVAPRFLNPVEPPADPTDLSEEEADEIYRLVADGVDDYKVLVRLVDGFGNVVDNFDLEGEVDSADAPYLDIDIDQIDPNFQKSAVKLLSYGGSWRQDNWKESGQLMYTSDTYFSKSGVSLGRGSAVRLASQSRVQNLTQSCGNPELVSGVNLGENRASALVFVGGRLATRVEGVGGLGETLGSAPDTSKYYLDTTGLLKMYCKPSDSGKTVSIQY